MSPPARGTAFPTHRRVGGGGRGAAPYGGTVKSRNTVLASLVYDAVVVVLAGAVVWLTDGTARAFAFAILVSAVLKAPYDVWEARRRTPDAAGSDD